MRVFRQDAGLDGVAANFDVFLLRQCPASRRDVELHLDQVGVRDLFRDRMFDLDAGVDLHEGELLPVDVVEKLDGSSIPIGDRRQQADGRCMQAGTDLFGQDRRGSFLDHLLVAPLDRTIALAEVHDASRAVAHHLDFEVARLLDVGLDVQRVIAKGLPGRRLCLVEGFGEFGRAARDDHPASTTAGRCLGDHGVAD